MERARPGDVVADRYEVVRALASGGMGEVLLARQLNLDRLVVLKRAVHAHSGRELRALADEALVAARLHHPNIVSVLDVIDAEAQPVVVLELVAGVSLRDVIDRAPGGLPVDVALAIAIDVLRGLAYAHAVRHGESVGVVHRDVKPRNVMVTFAGVTKLIDFGISHWLETDADEGGVMGTQGYMAPEQERGEAVDGRADQYAIGVTLGEMLVGATGPDGVTGASPCAPAALVALLDRACALRPEDRYADCGALIAVLEAYAAESGLQPSAMQVERWMSRHFVDRWLDLEHHAAMRPRRRTRPPTPQTVAQGSQRVPRHGRVALAARPAPGSGAGEGDAWLAPIVERLVQRALRDREECRLQVDRTDDAMWIELAYARTGEQGELVRIEARARNGHVLAAASGDSVAGAAATLAGALDAGIGALTAPREPDPAERDGMRLLGAGTPPLYRRYWAVLRSHWDAVLPNTPDEIAAIRGVLAADPAWAHAHALLAFLEGITTEGGRAARDAARIAAPAARDPSGAQLLRALDLVDAGDLPAALRIVEEVYRANEADIVAAQLLLWCALLLHRTEEAAAVARRLHARFPELMFGLDLAELLRREGRDAEGDRVIRAWAEAAPESASARTELARLLARGGRLDEARDRAREAVEIHRGRDGALPALFEALVETEQLEAARAIADRMLLGGLLGRARGRYRIAVLFVVEGRFAAAYDAVRRALEEHRAFGFQSELTQCLELARWLAPLVEDVEAQRGYTEELAVQLGTLLRDAGAAAAVRFELALIGGGGGGGGEARKARPTIEAHLDGLEGPVRDVARRRMLRSAAAVEAGSPHRAVAAGFSAFEDNTASLVALGLCAWRVRELALARRSFERAARLWSSSVSALCSPYHAVLAQFYLGGVLAELGEPAAARAAYEAFLRAWGDADRPVPEVAVARQVLAGGALGAAGAGG